MVQMIEMRSISEEVINKEVIAAQTTLASLKTTWSSLLVEVAEVSLELINRSNKIHKSSPVENNTLTRFHLTEETIALTSKVTEDMTTSSKTRD